MRVRHRRVPDLGVFLVWATCIVQMCCGICMAKDSDAAREHATRAREHQARAQGAIAIALETSDSRALLDVNTELARAADEYLACAEATDDDVDERIRV